VSARFAAARFEGIVEGQGSADAPLLMRFIPKRARGGINEGDVIVTSGLGGIYPAGIAVGRMSKLLSDEELTSIEIELSALIDFSRLEYVFVLVPEE
jgi:rod shape-determining protein MreC